MISEPKKLLLLPRIMELQQALFFNYSEAILKLPITIVNTLAVDELGQVWFAVNGPQQQRMQANFTHHPSTFVKTLQYIVKDIIPVFQTH
jgi:hypothetical protein